jgi:hypothetical protein
VETLEMHLNEEIKRSTRVENTLVAEIEKVSRILYALKDSLKESGIKGLD